MADCIDGICGGAPPGVARHPANGRAWIVGTDLYVDDVLRALENEHPAIAGWILDEQKTIREHVNVFVNGEKSREETELGAGDRIHVIPSISGG
jgi:molybdopterin converting factor small subunit